LDCSQWAWSNPFNQNQIVALKFAGKTVNSELLQSQAKTLLNQQLLEGKVN